MPQYDDDLYDDDDDDFEDSSDLVGKLRKQLRLLKKERDAAVAERESLTLEIRERVIVEAVSSAGYPPLVGKLIPADVQPDGVGAWLEANGSLFARANPEPVRAASDDAGESEHSVFDDADLRAQQAMNALGGSGPRSLDPVSDLKARIDGAQSQKELMEILQSAAL